MKTKIIKILIRNLFKEEMRIDSYAAEQKLDIRFKKCKRYLLILSVLSLGMQNDIDSKSLSSE